MAGEFFFKHKPGTDIDPDKWTQVLEMVTSVIDQVEVENRDKDKYAFEYVDPYYRFGDTSKSFRIAWQWSPAAIESHLGGRHRSDWSTVRELCKGICNAFPGQFALVVSDGFSGYEDEIGTICYDGINRVWKTVDYEWWPWTDTLKPESVDKNDHNVGDEEEENEYDEYDCGNDSDEDERQFATKQMRSYLHAASVLVNRIFPRLPLFREMLKNRPSMEHRLELMSKLDLSSIVFDLKDRPRMPFQNELINGMSERDIFQNAIIACWSIYPDYCMGLHGAIDYLAESTSPADLKDLSIAFIETLKQIAAKKDSCSIMFSMMVGRNASVILHRSSEQVSFGIASGNPMALMNERFNSIPSIFTLQKKYPEKSAEETLQMHKQMQFQAMVQSFENRAPSSLEPTTRRSCSCPGCPKTEKVVPSMSTTHVVPNESRFRFCSQCKLACYCSKECQKKHWKSHKTICKSSDANV